MSRLGLIANIDIYWQYFHTCQAAKPMNIMSISQQLSSTCMLDIMTYMYVITLDIMTGTSSMTAIFLDATHYAEYMYVITLDIWTGLSSMTPILLDATQLCLHN